MPIHYSFLSYDKSLVSPWGKKSEMKIFRWIWKKENIPVLEMEACLVLQMVLHNFSVPKGKNLWEQSSMKQTNHKLLLGKIHVSIIPHQALVTLATEPLLNSHYIHTCSCRNPVPENAVSQESRCWSKPNTQVKQWWCCSGHPEHIPCSKYVAVLFR